MLHKAVIQFFVLTLAISSISAISASVAHAGDKPVEIACTIRESGQSLNCIWIGKEKKTMTSDDVQAFIDQAAIFAYLTVRGHKGMERTFHPDPNSVQFKKLAEVKKIGSISELSRAKLDLFAEIEKKAIKLSDELDSQALQADLVKFDASVTGDKFKAEVRDMSKELDAYKATKDKLCTATPQFEALSKTNNSLQTALSNVLVAFQSPGTCMDGFKVFKDKDGTVDLRQLEGVGKSFLENCKKK